MHRSKNYAYSISTDIMMVNSLAKLAKEKKLNTTGKIPLKRAQETLKLISI